MAKMIPTFQTVVDLRDGTQVSVSKIVALGNSSDFVNLGRCEDARVLTATGQSVPTFYLTGSSGGTQKNILNLESATAGTEYLITARHRGSVNRNPGA